jgi:O-antigen ligase
MEVIPFKTHHHTLCILILDAIVISLILIYLYNQKKWVAYSLSVIVLFLGFTIHYVNARIGLIALYTFIILIVIYNLNKLKKYWWIATLIFIFLIGSIYFLPFISTRIKNSISEYKEQVLENKATLQSNMGVRILSQRVAIEILQHNIWKGIRPSEENKVYREGFQTYGREHHVEIPDLEDPYKPHNNFLRNAVIMGLPFGILFLTLFLSPLLRKEIYTSVFVTGFIVVNFLYCNSDYPFELHIWFYSFCFLLPFFFYSNPFQQKILK